MASQKILAWNGPVESVWHCRYLLALSDASNFLHQTIEIFCSAVFSNYFIAHPQFINFFYALFFIKS